MKKIRIILSTAALLLVMSLCGCGKKVVTYTTEDFISVNVSGVNGEGRLSTVSCSDEFLNRVNNDVFEGKASEIDIARTAVNIAAYADYEIVGEKTNLSNGDTVKVKMTADNESLGKLGLKFALNEYIYTVSGLEEPIEPEELDVWTGLEVTFGGISPKGSASAEYKGSDNFVKENVSYSLDKEYGLKNGDTVTVRARCYQGSPDENNFVIKEETKSFTAEGLGYYPSDLNGFDLTEIEDILEESVKGTMDTGFYDKDTELYGFQIFKGGNSSLEWIVTGDYTLKPVHKYVMASEPENAEKNIYTVFYEVKIPLKKHRIEKYAPFTDEYNEGDTYDLILYASSYMRMIPAFGDTLDTTDSVYSSYLYSGYAGESLETVEDVHNSTYSSWVKNDVK